MKRIRKGDDIETIVRHVDFGDLLLQVALTPEARFRYVFPFREDMPPYLIQPWNNYLKSPLFEWVAGDNPVGEADAQEAGHTETGAKCPFLKPFHAAEVIEVQLGSVEPSKWTTVCADNTLMRKILAAYIRQDYVFLTMFHKDIFFADMAAMRRQFCSSLLVNALLTPACVGVLSVARTSDHKSF